MKKTILYVLLLTMLLAATACQPAAVPEVAVTEAAVTAPESAGSEQLQVIGMQETKSLTAEDFLDLPVTEGFAGIKSSTGKITPPAKFSGILLTDLFDLVGGLDASMSVQVEAEDGYAMTLSGDQIINGDFITYDPSTGDEIDYDGKLQVILATQIEGKPLDAKSDGTQRMVVISDKPGQVTDGHWSVKWVRKISLKPLVEEWTVLLQGAITEEMDRGTFESGAAENCHKTTWVDDKAQTWTGIPLWLLAGRVDDDNKHGDDAFNDELAEAGYTIEVVAADGFSVTFDSQRVSHNEDLIVAYLANDNPLTEKDFPLRLVGSDAGKKESVGAIAKIILHLDQKPAEAAAPTEKPAETKPAASTSPAQSGNLQITGLVEAPQSWTVADLQKMELTKETVEHPKKGPMDLEGILLNKLLDLAKPNSDAKTLVLTASDGYSVEIALKDVRDCPKGLVAISDGVLSTAFPDLESSTWVKDLVSIEVK